MSDNSEVFSDDIHWQQIAVSRDMMDTTQGNGRFPFAWRSSLAVYAASPPDEDPVPCNKKILYLKVSANITGYQPSREETEQGYAQFPDVPVEDMDQILKEYFACYGAFLQVAVFPRMADTPLSSYPHIIDFEPKVRDLYQTATESGEILSASKSGVKTDRSFSQTQDTQTGLDVNTAVKFPIGKTGGTGEVGGSLSHKWGETNKDTWQVTADASRERREMTGMKTELSQMYNLLTGYHAGTNRAAFLMLPRPHILQPTDRRTFIQGVRVIEGVQDFFLIVEHPDDLEGVCVDVTLDTGHFPEDVDVQEPDEVYDEMSEDFWVEAYASPGLNGDRIDFEQTASAPAGWVVDRRKGDPGHPGCTEIANESNNRADNTLREYLYGALNDTTISVSGSIRGSDWWGAGAVFKRKYRAHYRSEEPLGSSVEPSVATPFLITNRRLGTCIVEQDSCFQEVAPDMGYWHDNGDWIVNEMSLEIPGGLMTKAAKSESRTPILKSLLQEIGTAMVRGGRLRTRYPYDTVGFLSSDYFVQQVGESLPGDYLDMALRDLAGIPASIHEALGEETSVAQVLAMDAATLSRKIEGSIEDAVALKQKIARRSE